MPVPECLFFEDLEGLTKVFDWMSAGISGPRLPLWADSGRTYFVECTDLIAYGVEGSLVGVWNGWGYGIACFWGSESSKFRA